MNIQDQQKAALEVLAFLYHDCGLDCVVAGGAARDWQHGGVAKDVDLFALNDDGSADYENFEEYARAVVRWLLGLDGITDTAVYTTYRDSPTGRLQYVIKFQYKGVSFDLISYMSLPSTAHQQVEQFDCTLNMVWYEYAFNNCPFEDSLKLGMHPQYSGNTGEVRALPELDGSWAERAAYLRTKYPLYNYVGAALD